MKYPTKPISRIISLLLAAALLTGCGANTTDTTVSTEPVTTSAPTEAEVVSDKETTNCYRVSGTDIVDAAGNPVLLKGIAIGNDVWSTTTPPLNDNNEESFRELSELGFNCVRFYLHYGFFEDDAAPYTYKESGFEWLEERIAWAKKYNVRLILNMHVPQGGYQSQGDGLALWQNLNNQNRLIALWTEIARRYANEDAIIGYSLINEPMLPVKNNISEATTLCKSLMQRIADSIRTVDTNHILFAERVLGGVNPTTGESVWDFSVNEVLYTINDTNTAYEFHYYNPYNFTHQNMDWSGQLGVITNYPSDKPVFGNAISYWTGCMAATQKEALEDGWLYFESDFAKKDSQSNAGGIALRAQNTGAKGTVLFDDLVVEEYKDGTLTRIISNLSFDDTTIANDFGFWSSNGSGSYYYSDTEGYGGSRCIALTGTTSDANVTGYRFPLEEGYTYKISGKVKLVDTASNCIACPRIDYAQYETISYCDISFLEAELSTYIEFSKKNQVPVFLGEFGVCLPAWQAKVGADQWVTDMITLCKKYNLHFNYHAYKDYWFGLYRYPINDMKRKINKELAEIFKEMLK